VNLTLTDYIWLFDSTRADYLVILKLFLNSIISASFYLSFLINYSILSLNTLTYFSFYFYSFILFYVFYDFISY